MINCVKTSHILVRKSLFSKFLFPRFANCRFIMTSCRRQAKNVELTCSPLSANVDKKVRVNVRGLAPNQKITLQTKLCGDVQDRYRSLAHYIADNEGRVCLNSQPSVGGSYVGVEPMGFIWSLKPEPDQRPGRRLMKRDVTKPYLVDLEVLDGHIHQIDNSYAPLCSLTIERHYMGAGVRRVAVHEGRIWGTLFLPPGDGPFQGVIDLIGGHGGLVEFKAALLASNGFAAFSLAYFNYEDLPVELEDLDLEYFLEAVDWFKNHPQVIPGGIGVMGISKGAEIACLLAAHSMDVMATVSIGGPYGFSICPILHKGKQIPFVKYDASKVVTYTVEDGAVSWRNCCIPDDWEGSIQDNPTVFPLENACGSLLLVYGTDDQCIDAELSASKLYERMKAFGKEAQCSILGYHGAGHIIEPPYSPHVFMSYQKSVGIYCAWGGEDKAHALAQEHSWSRILTFFQEHLPQNTLSKL
ncbi:hypothetical protein QZH41_016232 [Actinostola sp. cb2023]|nr:hypothetical protein QZH41_016232 [Actinostola sp. cb2023]